MPLKAFLGFLGLMLILVFLSRQNSLVIADIALAMVFVDIILITISTELTNPRAGAQLLNLKINLQVHACGLLSHLLWILHTKCLCVGGGEDPESSIINPTFMLLVYFQ